MTPSPISVAIQGEPGAFSHQAAEQLFGADLRLVPTRTFDDLFAAISGETAELGVVPVENTLAGSVLGNLDRILQSSLQVIAETRVRICLCLVAPPGRGVNEIRTAASHPVALQQCASFFRAHPDIEPLAVYDTAGSVQDLMEGDVQYDAAIGSELAASRYGAEILLPEIEDDHRNFTRFFAIARKSREFLGRSPGQAPHLNAEQAPGGNAEWAPGGNAEQAPGGNAEWAPHGNVEHSPHRSAEHSLDSGSKTSLAFVVPHEPGSLHRALGLFAEAGVDLTKLESRPIPGRPWEYRFYADVRGDPRGATGRCLDELRAMASELHILGTYPEWPEKA